MKGNSKLSKKIKARQFMLVQDLDNLSFDLKELEDRLSTLHANEWAYILHNKDQSKNGGLVKPHIHCVVKFENERMLTSLAKKLEIKPQYFQIWSGRINNAYSYMLHLTNNAQNKHIYSPKDVVASFDFPKRIKEITNKVSKQEIKDALTMYSNGALSREELKIKMGNLAFAKSLDIIKKLDTVLDDQTHKEWLKSFQNKKMTVDWYYGEAGVGKTRLALKKAKEYGEQYCVLGSSNDYFQDYKAQDHIVILDELRPNDIKYGDLLKIMDPYQHDKHAPRRYRNVALNIEELIITTPYKPETFYKMTKIADRKVDTMKQLLRRISKVTHVTGELAKRSLKRMKNNNILNATDLMKELNISSTRFYQFLHHGMPYHQIGEGRKYYMLNEVLEWLRRAGYRQEKTWIK